MRKLYTISAMAAALLSGVIVTAQSIPTPQYMSSMDGQFEQNPKLADLLDAMENGPAQADANGSTFEAPKAHRSGPHEMAFQTWVEYSYRMSAPGANPADMKAQMKEALASDKVSNGTKVWLIREFQWFGTEEDVDALVPFLTSPEYTLRDEAIRTISKIPGQKSIDALKAAAKNADDLDRKRIADAIRQQIQDISRTNETEMPQGLPYASTDEVEKWMKGYAQLSDELKIETIASLTVLGDRKYLPVVLDAFNVEGENADFFKTEAILALEKLATANEVPVLLENLKFDRNLVIRVASVVEADGFDEALVKALDSADPETFNAICAILTNRSTNVFEKIVAKISSSDCANRNELMSIVCRIAAKEDVPALVDTLTLYKEGGERDSAEKEIASVCGGDSAPILTKERDLALVLPLLGRVGDDAAWKIIDENLKNESMREIAIRALCNLPNAKQAEKMLTVVDGDTCSDGQKIAALRAYIRVVSLPDDQIGISANPAKKLEMLRGAMDRATRVDEKKLVLSRLNAIRDAASAKFAMEFVSDPALEQDVYRAIVDLAHHDNVRRPNAAFFGPALELVIEKCTNNDLVVRAKKYHDML